MLNLQQSLENRETIILQTHIDMVHQKNSDTVFDFDTEGIRSYIEEGWVKAEGTTLGADNGMGVAAAMSLLSSSDLKHPTIEALFTIDEETGMTGAKELDGSLLSGKILLNLDTEDDDEFSVGCAGGIDTNSTYSYTQENIGEGYTLLDISVKGLKGGHSGMDIHLGRGNANLIMNRILIALRKNSDVRIVELSGGSLRNAIPRESAGVIAVQQDKSNEIISIFNTTIENIKIEFGDNEPGLEGQIVQSNSEATQMMDANGLEVVLSVIEKTPNAVWKMSENIEGLVETSSSFARVIIKDGVFETKSLQRSMDESGKKEIAAEMLKTYTGIGAEVVQGGDYPGWSPNPNSRILDVLKKNYSSMFGEEPKVAACHAGLECGILGKHLPGCDMISFGPTIRNPHSPDEKVNIKSVQKFWSFLLKVVEDTPYKN